MTTKKKVAVFGSAVAEEDSPEYRGAVEIGRIIGETGYDILCGGYAGIMEAVCKGCHGAGGRCHGIGLEHFHDPPNPYINAFVKAGSLGQRLDYFIAHAEIFLALSGGIGTVTEVMFVWDLLKSGQITGPAVLLYGSSWKSLRDTFRSHFIIDPDHFRHLHLIGEPEELALVLRKHGVEDSA